MYCPACGAPNAEGVRFCVACAAELPSARAVVPGPRLAGLGDRLIATILDVILLAAVYAVAGMMAAAYLGGVTDTGFSLSGTPALVAIGATVVIGGLYFWLLEGLAGATLGKTIAGVRVRRKAGGRCGLGRSLLRNLLRLVDGIALYLVGFLVAIVSRQRQRVGDHVAGTVVVEAHVGTAARAGLVLLWLALIGGGLFEAYRIHQQIPAGTPVPSSVRMTTTGRLKVVNFDFLASKGGPSRPAGPYKPGDSVYIKYDVVGFKTDRDGKPNLLLSALASDPAGLPIHFARVIDTGTPVHGSFSLDLPEYAPGGVYKIEIRVHDQLQNADVQLAPTFEVEAPAITPARGLEIRDFRLSLSQDGPALAVPALEGGGSVYMKCNLFGLQFRGEQASARMAFRLISPNGKILLDRPEYVNINRSYVYHPPGFYVPITGDVTIPSGFEKGTYTEEYTVRDNVANQAIRFEAKFEVK